jgi:hypothetical protein
VEGGQPIFQTTNYDIGRVGWWISRNLVILVRISQSFAHFFVVAQRNSAVNAAKIHRHVRNVETAKFELFCLNQQRKAYRPGRVVGEKRVEEWVHFLNFDHLWSNSGKNASNSFECLVVCSRRLDRINSESPSIEGGGHFPLLTMSLLNCPSTQIWSLRYRPQICKCLVAWESGFVHVVKFEVQTASVPRFECVSRRNEPGYSNLQLNLRTTCSWFYR